MYLLSITKKNRSPGRFFCLMSNSFRTHLLQYFTMSYSKAHQRSLFLLCCKAVMLFCGVIILCCIFNFAYSIIVLEHNGWMEMDGWILILLCYGMLQSRLIRLFCGLWPISILVCFGFNFQVWLALLILLCCGSLPLYCGLLSQCFCSIFYGVLTYIHCFMVYYHCFVSFIALLWLICVVCGVICCIATYMH